MEEGKNSYEVHVQKICPAVPTKIPYRGNKSLACSANVVGRLVCGQVASGTFLSSKNGAYSGIIGGFPGRMVYSFVIKEHTAQCAAGTARHNWDFLASVRK